MTYVLQRTPDGGAVVSRQVLTPLATFRSLAMAEDFMAWVARERPAEAVATEADGAVAAGDPTPAVEADPDDDPDRGDDEAELAALCAGGPEAGDVAEDRAEDDPVAVWEGRTLQSYNAAIATRPGDAEDAIDAAADLPMVSVDDPSMKLDAAPPVRGDGETARVAIRPAATPAPVFNDQPPAPEPAPDPYGPQGEAFARLRAGEKLGTVADELGLAMPKLRSAWARSGERAETPAPAPARDRPVMDAIDRDAADLRRQPPPLARPAERPALNDGWAWCDRCRIAFNAEDSRRRLKADERPTRCAACRARS